LTWAIGSRTTETLRAEYGVGDEDVSLNERGKREKLSGEGEKERRKRKRYAELCELLPPSVRRREEDIEKRFRADWKVAKEVWVRFPFLSLFRVSWTEHSPDTGSAAKSRR
jgi:hypothetical protein